MIELIKEVLKGINKRIETEKDLSAKLDLFILKAKVQGTITEACE
jgi:hypothetical protein